jgi:hypothetical protein
MSFDFDDLFRGDLFPNLKKAQGAKPLTDLVAKLKKDDKELFELAQKEKIDQRKQRENDFKTFFISNKSAMEQANVNSCADNKQWGAIDQQIDTNKNKSSSNNKIPAQEAAIIYGRGKKQIKLPQTRNSSGTNLRNRPSSLTQLKFNQGNEDLDKENYSIHTVNPTQYEEKAKQNYVSFIQAHSGKRGKALGDRAIFFSANGTPHYGDSYLDKSLQDNLSANLATSTPTTYQIPKEIKEAKPLEAKALVRGNNGQVAPKQDSAGNFLAMGAIAVAITAIMFAIQYVISTVSFVMQFQLLVANITNIAQSFIAIFNSISALLGLGEDVAKPLEDAVDGIMNNVFGVENVAYVKLQFAKVSSAFTAGFNILSKVRSSTKQISDDVKESSSKTSILLNSLKSMGIIDEKLKWFDESVGKKNEASKFNALNDGLSKAGNYSGDLTSIVQDAKTAKQDQDNLDKEYQLKLKEKEDKEKETSTKYDVDQIPLSPPIGNKDL